MDLLSCWGVLTLRKFSELYEFVIGRHHDYIFLCFSSIFRSKYYFLHMFLRTLTTMIRMMSSGHRKVLKIHIVKPSSCLNRSAAQRTEITFASASGRCGKPLANIEPQLESLVRAAAFDNNKLVEK